MGKQGQGHGRVSALGCIERDGSPRGADPPTVDHVRAATRWAAALALVVVATQPGRANDGFGALGAGGIVVARTDQIALTHESLDISQSQIYVRYDFINISDRDMTTTVSFPLPTYAAFPRGMALPRAVPPDFTVDVWGAAGTQPTHPSFKTRVWAVLNGVDITNRLVALGISEKQIALMPFDEITEDHPYLKRSPAVVAELRKAGWVDDGGEPMWDVHVAYEWQQTFPARKPLHVSHFYRPFYSGGTVSGYNGPNDTWLGDDWLRNGYCASDKMIDEMHDLFARKNDLDGYNEVPGAEVDYVLMTGNTWKNGIEDFELTVRPQSPYELVAFCLNGTGQEVPAAPVTAFAPRAIGRHYGNFHPSADLKILFANSWYGDWFTGDSRPAFRTGAPAPPR